MLIPQELQLSRKDKDQHIEVESIMGTVGKYEY